MNLVRDSEGSIIYGLLEPHVYYSRFTGKLTARLGTGHLNDLQQAVDAGSGISYFADASELVSYDLLARSALVRLLLGHRKRFAEVLLLNASSAGAAHASPSASASSSVQALAATVGKPVAMVDDRNEFERRLSTASPRALSVIRGAGTLHSGVVPVASPSAALRVTRG